MALIMIPLKAKLISLISCVILIASCSSGGGGPMSQEEYEAGVLSGKYKEDKSTFMDIFSKKKKHDNTVTDNVVHASTGSVDIPSVGQENFEEFEEFKTWRRIKQSNTKDYQEFKEWQAYQQFLRSKSDAK